jgi:cystathionine beta-lyase/cystathionine gamma-synthase
MDTKIFCPQWGHELITGFIERERRGIPENYYRMSVGIENPEDIIANLKQALEKI